MTKKSNVPIHRNDNDHPEFDGTDALKSYLEYNKVLRTWFVAFGIGGPAMFLVHEEIPKVLEKAGNLQIVLALFLIGAAAQVVGALINKVANWYVYLGTIKENSTGYKYVIADWLIEQFWIDILIDLITIISFGVSVWLMLTVLAVGG